VEAAAGASNDGDGDGDDGAAVDGDDETQGASLSNKHFLSVGWVLSDGAQLPPVTRIALVLMDHLLLGTNASPLR
jgi:hypothetical protein